MRYLPVILLVLMVNILPNHLANGGCGKHKSCTSCAKSSIKVNILIKTFRKSCRWCPLSESCHNPISVKNDCQKSGIDITSPKKCPRPNTSKVRYSSKLAQMAAMFSSLAYARPREHGKISVNSVVKDFISPNYQVIQFLTADCDKIKFLKYSHCAAVVARSTRDKRIVVAFRGTTSPLQLTEQVVKVVTGMTKFRPTGGKVLRYNSDLHRALYPCIKSLLSKLLTDRSYKVLVTGHSLGGAQAQLTAAALIKDRVVTQAKVEVYTFGSPRVGDRKFAFRYDQLVANSWRVVRAHDPVPLVIPKATAVLPFAYHTRQEVFYNTAEPMTPSTKYKKCRGNEDKRCALSKAICKSAKCFKRLLSKHSDYFFTNLPDYLKKKMTCGKHSPTGVKNKCYYYSFV